MSQNVGVEGTQCKTQTIVKMAKMSFYFSSAKINTVSISYATKWNWTPFYSALGWMITNLLIICKNTCIRLFKSKNLKQKGRINTKRTRLAQPNLYYFVDTATHATRYYENTHLHTTAFEHWRKIRQIEQKIFAALLKRCDFYYSWVVLAIERYGKFGNTKLLVNNSFFYQFSSLISIIFQKKWLLWNCIHHMMYLVTRVRRYNKFGNKKLHKKCKPIQQFVRIINNIIICMIWNIHGEQTR
jgi:hypothetical protein